MNRDLRGYGKTYPVISWPNDALIAVSLVVHFQEGAERTPLYGDNGPELSAQPVRPAGPGTKLERGVHLRVRSTPGFLEADADIRQARREGYVLLLWTGRGGKPDSRPQNHRRRA